MAFPYPKTHRLLRRSDFRRVYDHGTPYRNAGFHLFVLERDDAVEPGRFGLTVTRRAGGSVTRNRLRRWAREDLRHWIPSMRGGVDAVLNFHGSLAQYDRETFDRKLRHVLEKAQILDPRKTRG